MWHSAPVAVCGRPVPGRELAAAALAGCAARHAVPL